MFNCPSFLIRNADTKDILTYSDENNLLWYITQYACQVLQYIMVRFSYIVTALQ